MKSDRGLCQESSLSKGIVNSRASNFVRGVDMSISVSLRKLVWEEANAEYHEVDQSMCAQAAIQRATDCTIWGLFPRVESTSRRGV